VLVRTTLPPAQKLVAPPAAIVADGGVPAPTVTVTFADLEHVLLPVAVTVYVVVAVTAVATGFAIVVLLKKVDGVQA
jgi:hypothetical protein